MLEKSINEEVYGGGTDAVEGLDQENTVGTETEAPPAPSKSFGSLFEKLKTPALEKPIEEYKDHAFNRGRSEHVGRFIRGVEAFLGNTNLALFDVIFGMLGMVEERKAKTGVEVGVHGV